LAPLAPRETEVARLIGEGFSNRQIGTRLFISERTVENHVRNVMDKLGFTSRTQIAAWVASPASPRRAVTPDPGCRAIR
ncbi:helix-turn-helix transcriptional regulator, partial [Sedimentibacter sp. B4]|uniref:helix-turn-helix domain-containing protein n=1 Tax=Sedimentibacter sp. B4 TaxID=304766 RepID=UPI0018DCF133